jgi:hypothetical protein
MNPITVYNQQPGSDERYDNQIIENMMKHPEPSGHPVGVF